MRASRTTEQTNLANVFYEAGIALTLVLEVILITQNFEDVPFDLRHLQCDMETSLSVNLSVLISG